MSAEGSMPIPADELRVAILQGPASSGKSTVAGGLESLGFTTIGLGAFYRGIDSLYISRYPDQVDRFCPEQFTDFMEGSADEVQAVMRGQLAPPHEDLKHPDIQSTVGHVGEADVSQVVVNDYAIELLASMRGLVFMEGRALDRILRERTEAGQFSGKVVANFFVDVSDEIALERNLTAAEAKGIILDPDEELAKIKERNHRDRTRAVNPMELPRDRLEIKRGINAPTAYQIGFRAVGVSRLRRDPIPVCVHMQTDNLLVPEAREISQNVTRGGLRVQEPSVNQLVSATL